ncbi:hypothetical protein BC936DRAFT_137758 [Jimgerdemannia flammicorona]|uniref:Uncharacterized protein n=1 Tax=Jimgerdemannia flammicorona TaxID=994334 RepID=A0A433CWR7_9FUNG|nr:hypothetical protein BC936DRAFT_137758 [Jimgerdemannia flammicorona]
MPCTGILTPHGFIQSVYFYTYAKQATPKILLVRDIQSRDDTHDPPPPTHLLGFLGINGYVTMTCRARVEIGLEQRYEVGFLDKLVAEEEDSEDDDADWITQHPLATTIPTVNTDDADGDVVALRSGPSLASEDESSDDDGESGAEGVQSRAVR